MVAAWTGSSSIPSRALLASLKGSTPPPIYAQHIALGPRRYGSLQPNAARASCMHCNVLVRPIFAKVACWVGHFPEAYGAAERCVGSATGWRSERYLSAGLGPPVGKSREGNGAALGPTRHTTAGTISREPL